MQISVGMFSLSSVDHHDSVPHHALIKILNRCPTLAINAVRGAKVVIAASKVFVAPSQICVNAMKGTLAVLASSTVIVLK